MEVSIVGDDIQYSGHCVSISGDMLFHRSCPLGFKVHLDPLDVDPFPCLKTFASVFLSRDRAKDRRRVRYTHVVVRSPRNPRSDIVRCWPVRGSPRYAKCSAAGS